MFCINFQVTYDKEELGKDVTGPKHGRVDPTGAPHVGGNQWAGGTGMSHLSHISYVMVNVLVCK